MTISIRNIDFYPRFCTNASKRQKPLIHKTLQYNINMMLKKIKYTAFNFEKL